MKKARRVLAGFLIQACLSAYLHAAAMSVEICCAPVLKLGMSCATGLARHCSAGLGKAVMYWFQNDPCGTALLVSESPNNCFMARSLRPTVMGPSYRMLSERKSPVAAGVPLIASVQGVGVVAPALWYAWSMTAASPPEVPPVE